MVQQRPTIHIITKRGATDAVCNQSRSCETEKLSKSTTLKSMNTNLSIIISIIACVFTYCPLFILGLWLVFFFIYTWTAKGFWTLFEILCRNVLTSNDVLWSSWQIKFLSTISRPADQAAFVVTLDLTLYSWSINPKIIILFLGS